MTTGTVSRRGADTDAEPWTEQTERRWNRRYVERARDQRLIDRLDEMGLPSMAEMQAVYAYDLHSIGPWEAVTAEGQRPAPATTTEGALDLVRMMVDVWEESGIETLDWQSRVIPERASAHCRGCWDLVALSTLAAHDRGLCPKCIEHGPEHAPEVADE